MSFVRQNKYIILLLITAAVLRFMNLGYSDYQGDEIKAFFLPEENQTLSEFFLDQRKGPIQFLLTLGIKVLDSDYSNRLLARAPFAFAGLLSVYFFYEFVRYNFGKDIALYSTFFFATNGFLIAFSRIVQYQSYVILFMILALYFLTLAVKDVKYSISGIYLGLISWAISILSHYDGVFIAPFVFYLLFVWYKDVSSVENKLKIRHFVISGIISSILLLSFYIPFVNTISDDTQDYWEGRITGDVSVKISSSKYLFTVYQPIYVIHLYTFLAALGFIYTGLKVLPKLGMYFGKRAIVKKIKDVFPFAAEVINHLFSAIFGRSLVLCLALFAWFLLPFIFLEVIVYIPGTHIYSYLIPLFIFVGFGSHLALKFTGLFFKGRLRKVILGIGMAAVFLFISAQSYAVFVDHLKEYPWEYEKFLVWTFPKPTPTYHLSMFGFPYYRNWDGVRAFTKGFEDEVAYSTNERKSIVRYHIPLRKSSNKAGFYVYVLNPQSFIDEVINEKPAYWIDKYEPDWTFSRDGKALTRVYVMENGSLEEIKEKGF